MSIKFENNKELTTGNGLILHMKALLTICGVKYIEVYENDIRYHYSELKEIK